jgi:hypothetical protein
LRDGLFVFSANPMAMKISSDHKRAVLFLFALLTISIGYPQTVYVTRTGAKYHDNGCRYLSKSKIEIGLKDAKEKGYTACSVCDPPTTVTATQDRIRSTQSPVKKAQSTQCTALTKANRRCLRMTTNANGRCWQHQ